MDRIRGLIPVVFAVVSLGLASTAVAFSADDPAGPANGADGPQKPLEITKPSVEDLLDELARAKSAEEAKALEGQIVAAWNESGSDTVDLLVGRAGVAIQERNYGVALQYLDTIVELKPDFAEGWNMRATVYYLLDEYELSIADIERVLVLQPRHFGALSGLGMIFGELDEPKKALEAYRAVLAVDPYFGKARESVKKLEVEVEGREI